MSRPSLQLAFARSRRSLARPSSFQPATLLPSSPARRPSSSSSGSLPPSSTAPYRVFDRANVLHHRQVAFQKDGGDRSRTVGYLREEIGERVMERFEDVKPPSSDPANPDAPPRPLDLLEITAGPGTFASLLVDDGERVGSVEIMDWSEAALSRDPDDDFDVPITRTAHDEEHLLKHVGEGSKDAVVSVMGLHWVNDLPGVLSQIQRSLRPNGFFLGAMLGGETLFELRTALQLADLERTGGIGAHVSPMVDPKDVSSLLQRAGFTMLTVDVEEIVMGYPSVWELMQDLKDMGESNSIFGRHPFIKRDTLIAASSIYTALHGIPAPAGANAVAGGATPEEGVTAVPATFQVVFMMGWKEGSSVAKPLARGAGKVPLKGVL